MSTPNVTLQISLAPTDLPHARYIVPHQLKQWAGQVDEIVFTLDLHRSKGRFSEGWHERLPKLVTLVGQMITQYPHARLVEVDYSKIREVSDIFFGAEMPPKDFRGGPFYSYFFGLYASRHDTVFHLDSDMLFGGGSQSWVNEALGTMSDDVLTCSPLPGPPTRSGDLTNQSAEQVEPWAFRFPTMSTRLFLVKRSRLASALSVITQVRGRKWLKARLEGNAPYDLPEHIISTAMQHHSLSRIDFLGANKGMWSLHPPYRSPEFYAALSGLIKRIESGDIPDAQRGCYDVNSSLVDWSSAVSALRNNRWWRRHFFAMPMRR